MVVFFGFWLFFCFVFVLFCLFVFLLFLLFFLSKRSFLRVLCARRLEDIAPVAIRICFAEYCFESTSTLLAETNLANP